MAVLMKTVMMMQAVVVVMADDGHVRVDGDDDWAALGRSWAAFGAV